VLFADFCAGRILGQIHLIVMRSKRAKQRQEIAELLRIVKQSMGKEETVSH
jgi:hypothetical protein